MALTRLSLLALLLLSSTGVSGEILYWARSSNWNDPVNWSQSRLPCSAETVILKPPKTNGRLLPATFDVQISTDVSLKKILIPIDGSLMLKKGAKLSLSTAGTCKDQGLTSVTDQSINSFIGVQPHPWDCVGNWRNSKGALPSQPPCREDTVVFQANNSYSWIELDSQVKVARLGWLGQSVDGLSDIPDYDKYFYKSTPSADLTVDPSCLAGNPERCPCQASNCSFYPTRPPTVVTKETPETEGPIPSTNTPVICPDGSQTCNTDPSTGSSSILWIAVGAGVGGALLLIILIVVIVVVLRKRKSKAVFRQDTTPVFGKDDMSGFPAYTSSSGFDNPVFQAEMVPKNPLYSNEEYFTVENPDMTAQESDNPYESLGDYVKSE